MSSNLFKDTEEFSVKRKRQIDTLKIFNDNVQEVVAGVEYRVEFWAGARRMALIVHLGKDFPLEKPVLSASPTVTHPWVDHHSRITAAPGLVNFTEHSDLGRVVHAIVREFELRPPSWISSDGSAVGSSESSSPTDTTAQTQAPAAPIQPALQTTIFPELADLSVSELTQLLENGDRLAELVEGLPECKELDDSLEQLMAATETLAKENLDRQSELENARAACEERRQELGSLHQSYEALSLQFQALADRRTPASIRESLRAATLQADEESERLAEHFLSGGMSVDKFLVAYINKRMMSHSRRIKEEKLSQQLRDLLRAGY